jgi:hypothetical protein
MAYSFDDFFEHNLAPKLRELLLKECPEDEDRSDQFLAIIERAFSQDRNERFAYTLLRRIVDPHEEHSQIDEIMDNFFNSMNFTEGAFLRKIEYSHNNAVVKVDYMGDHESCKHENGNSLIPGSKCSHCGEFIPE